jgi:hypothetical protein
VKLAVGLAQRWGISSICGRKIMEVDGGCSIMIDSGRVPSGKQPHSSGKSLFLMGKFTINGHFQ